MNYKRLSALLATAGMVALLSGCVVAPLGVRPYGAYQPPPVYVEPAPVVVVPAPGYYRGYYGYGGYGGYRRFPGYSGYGGPRYSR